ncbi:MAG: hypothetical protein JWM46_608 [Candidatus Kaiserbacteria bacterium]|nr:hypothetical protein [Candidatus Kaiserbacteria bacterium]
MNTFSVRGMVRFGWDTFKKRPWFFIGVTLLITVINSLVSRAFPGVTWTQQTGMLMSAPYIFGTVINFILQVFVGMGTIALYLKAHDDVVSAQWKDLWHPQAFGRYFILSLLLILVSFSFVLLIVPGIIFTLMFQFAPYLVIDKGMGPIEAMKESARMTKGHKWQMFTCDLAFVGVVIVGALCIIVGLLAAIPVTYLAIAHMYRTISSQAVAEVPAQA